ncbi:hypothetical protein XbC2_81 [Xanthomonas phage XbC2]|nr:hypothetical protein XbC2_81 [Xanthomonas phage XbC2]
MSELTPREQLAVAVNKIDQAIADAIAIADEHGLSFDLDVSYGMGGTYYPPAMLQDEEDGSWLVEEYYLDADQGGWVASSQTC